jgi:hypothetical protein
VRYKAGRAACTIWIHSPAVWAAVSSAVQRQRSAIRCSAQTDMSCTLWPVGRLTWQKGVDIIVSVLDWLMTDAANGVNGNCQVAKSHSAHPHLPSLRCIAVSDLMRLHAGRRSRDGRAHRNRRGASVGGHDGQRRRVLRVAPTAVRRAIHAHCRRTGPVPLNTHGCWQCSLLFLRLWGTGHRQSPLESRTRAIQHAASYPTPLQV